MHQFSKANKIFILFAFIFFFFNSVYYQRDGTYRQVIYDQERYLDLSKAFVSMMPKYLRPHYTDQEKRIAKFYEKDLHSQMAFQGFAYPAYLAFIQVLTHSSSINLIRGSQIILNLFSLYLLILILAYIRKVQNISVWLALLFICYMPFIYMGTLILSENLALFLIISIVYLTLRLHYNKPSLAGIIILSGGTAILLNILFFTRPVYFYFSLAYLPVVMFAALSKHFPLRQKITISIFTVILFLLPYAFWVYYLNNHLQSEKITFSITRNRSVDNSLNESYWLDIDGFPTAKISQEKERYAPVAKESITSDPSGSFLLRLEKFYRLWVSPSIAYSNPAWGDKHTITKIYHLLLLMLAFLGLFAIKRWLVRIIIGLPILYTTVIYTLYFSEEHRFIYPIMPLMILLATVAIDAVGSSFRSMNIIKKRKVYLLLICIGFGIVVLNYPYNDHYRDWYNETFYYAGLTTGMIFIVIPTIYLLRIVNPSLLKEKLFLALGIFIASSILIHYIKYTRWYIWSLPLDTTLSKRFNLSCIDPKKIERAYIQIDLVGHTEYLTVKANGIPLKVADKYISFDKIANEQMYPLRNKDDYTRYRHWRLFQLDADWLKNVRELNITIHSSDKSKQADIKIYGSYLSNNLKYCGPRLSFMKEGIDSSEIKKVKKRYSLWKYQTDGDIRLYGCQIITKCEDQINNPHNPPSKEKYYTIRLQLFHKNGNEVVF